MLAMHGFLKRLEPLTFLVEMFLQLIGFTSKTHSCYASPKSDQDWFHFFPTSTTLLTSPCVFHTDGTLAASLHSVFRARHPGASSSTSWGSFVF